MIKKIEAGTNSLPPGLPRGIISDIAAANTNVQSIIAPRITWK